MRRLKLRPLLLAFLVIVSQVAIALFGTQPALAQTVPTALAGAIPTITYTDGQLQVQAPDWSQISFSSLPPLEEPGWIEVPSQLAAKLGYDPSRIWQAGATIEQVLKLGDIAEAFRPEVFKLQDISGLTGLAIQNLNLNDFGLMNWQTAKSLVKAIPGLGELPISQVEPMGDLLSQVGAGGAWDEKIATIAADKVLGELPLGKYLDLSQYSLDSIPGLPKIPIYNFKAWQQSFIAQVPGLTQVPLAQMPLPIPIGVGKVALHDLTWSAAEHGNPQAPANLTLSGSVNRKGKVEVVPCSAGEPCAYLELSDPLGAKGSMYGKRWVSGKVQKVKGGFGPLRTLNGGWEPTGLLPYGSAFKVVLLNTNESKGSASYGLYFRACVHIPFYGKSCSPYFIGPAPWLPTQEKGLVIVASAARPQVDIPSKYQQQIDAIRQQYEPRVNPDGNSSYDNCIGGVSGEAVERAIAAASTQMRSYANQTVPLVLAAAKKYGVTDPAQVAYILSTVQTETTMGAKLVEGATRNKSAPGSIYYGRGLPQLTGIDNYRKASKIVGVDLVNHPEKAADPELSAKILVIGMRDGVFTGRKLNDFIGNGKADFVGARQIVNDSDKQVAMAQDAQRYLAAISGTSIAALKESGSTCATNVASGRTQQRIYQAAKDSYGMDSSRSGLPGGGNVACAWAVNRVLNQAGIPSIGSNPNLVFSVRDALEAGRGQEIKERSQAKAGDLALALGSGSKQHIGICMNDGCTQVISNSSSRESFTWKSNTDFGGYYGVPSKIYRVVK